MSEHKIYDTIIIGSGPAGLGAAYELTKNGKSVLMIERGHRIESRKCPIIEGKSDKCCNCQLCNITSGAGGSGTFSDFKMNLNTEFGGNLLKYINKEELQNKIDYVYFNLYKKEEKEDNWIDYGGFALNTGTSLFSDDIFKTKFEYLKEKCIKNNISLLKSDIKHIGSDNAPKVISDIINKLKETGNFEIIYNKDINSNGISFDEKNNTFHIMYDEYGMNNFPPDSDCYFDHYYSHNLIIATGRGGSDFCYDVAYKFGIPTAPATVDIGVRVETNSEITKEFTDAVYDFKAVYNTPTFDDKVRSFCVNPNGFVATESTDGLLTVNGYSNANKKSDNTNFAVLVSVDFTEPFDDPNKYVKYIANLGNMLSGGIMVQTLGDLKRGRRTTIKRLNNSIVKPTLNAEPGDLSFVLPYRFLTDIKEYLYALDKVMPGINNDSTLLYGVEAKYYSRRILVDKTMKNNCSKDNLYFVGDGAGISRGIIQATVSGILAAEDILKND